MIAELQAGVPSLKILTSPGAKHDGVDQAYVLKPNTSYALYVRWITEEVYSY